MVFILNLPPSSLTPVEAPTEITFIDKRKEAKGKKYFAPETQTRTQDDIYERLKQEVNNLSLLTKRVKKQLIARNSGPNRNSQLNLKPAPIDSASQQSEPQRPPGEEAIAKPLEVQLSKVAIGGSSTRNYIPGVEQGAFTALNTDQLTYYAFFSRVNEQMGNRWVDLIRQYMNSLSHEQLAHLAKSDRVTIAEIILSRSGEFVRAILHSSSSIKPLDHAAVEAFRRAAPFLNPPKELIEADGFIHMRYHFILVLRPTFGPGSH